MNQVETSTRLLLIDGEWRQGEAGTLQSVNPATGLPNHEIACAGAGDVELAVASAQAAVARKGWAGMLAHARAAILHRMGELLEAKQEMFARLQMAENGKVYTECLAQAKSAAATFRYYAAVCETLGEEITPARGPYLSMRIHEPYGVVAAITPWNSPVPLQPHRPVGAGASRPSGTARGQ